MPKKDVTMVLTKERGPKDPMSKYDQNIFSLLYVPIGFCEDSRVWDNPFIEFLDSQHHDKIEREIYDLKIISDIMGDDSNIQWEGDAIHYVGSLKLNSEVCADDCLSINEIFDEFLASKDTNMRLLFGEILSEENNKVGDDFIFNYASCIDDILELGI